MLPRVTILLGRSLWTRDATGWRRESFSDGDGFPGPAVERLAEFLSADSRGRTVVVFEPDDIAHQAIDTPLVNRSVFASLARVRSDHPVVASDRLGWGIEAPEPTQGGVYSTLMHSELTPGLVHVRDSCIRGRSRLVAAWPAYTAAVACMRSCMPPSKARYVIVMAPNYVAVATCGGGKRAYRGWTGPMSDKDWKAFAIVIGGFEARSAPSMAEVILKRGGIAAIADGDPASLCPIWGEIRASGRLESVVNFEALAAAAASIPENHPANLVEAFPTPRRLDGYLIGASVIGMSCALAFGGGTLLQRAQIRTDGARYSVRTAALQARLATLEQNRREMTRLRNQAPVGDGARPLALHPALRGLAASVPDSLLLVSLAIRRDASFEIGALVVGGDFDPQSFRQSLQALGFEPAPLTGWSLDAASGTLSIRGKYGEPRS